ncbi:MAG: hypothetical protein ACI9LY_002641 [Arenicella sp.]|jgi:hypothetical protein
MKKLLIAGLGILAIIAIAMFVFAGKMDGIVKDVIEKEGSAALGSPVTVGSVVTDLTNGSVAINNLAIANPVGYKAKNAIEVTSFSASVDYQNQVVDTIEIDQPIINAEQKGKNNNFQDLLDNMPVSAEEEDSSTEEDTTVITINQLALRRATVNLITSGLSLGGQAIELGDRKFVMDDFVLNNLSGTATQISDEVVEKLTAHVSAQVANYLKDEIVKIAKATVKLKENLEGKVGEKLKSLKFRFGKD